MESNEIMRSIAAEKRAPAKLRGYVVVDDKDPEGHFRLYPQLDPSSYYLVPDNCVLATRDIEDADRLEVVVKGDCEVQRVSRSFAAASDLRDDERPDGKVDCGRGCGCGPCGGNCGRGETPWGSAVYYYRDRSKRIRFLMAWARALKAFGIDEFDCKQVNSLSASCCRAVNDLLDAVGPGPDDDAGYAEADTALCICGGDC